jgi:hypothetical protein
VLSFKEIGDFFMAPKLSFFQSSLQAARSAWRDLNDTLMATTPVNLDDIMNDFNHFAAKTTQVCAASRSNLISDCDRETIDKILLGDEGIPNLLSMEKLLEKLEEKLELEASEKPDWDAMAKMVKDACQQLARI